MAASRAPMMFQKAQYGPRVVGRIPAEAGEQLPRSAREEIASPAIIEGNIQRIEGGLATLREQLRAYRPDALLMIGDDQGDLFDETNNPTFSVYTGEEPLWGRSARDSYDTPPAERTKLVFKPHPELSRHLHRGLVKRGFDMASIGRLDPRGNPTRGVSHLVSNLVPEFDPGLQIPLICVFMNEYYPPLPSAAPCARLGDAIADVLRDRPDRIPIHPSAAPSPFPALSTPT